MAMLSISVDQAELLPGQTVTGSVRGRALPERADSAVVQLGYDSFEEPERSTAEITLDLIPSASGAYHDPTKELIRRWNPVASFDVSPKELVGGRRFELALPEDAPASVKDVADWRVLARVSRAGEPEIVEWEGLRVLRPVSVPGCDELSVVRDDGRKTKIDLQVADLRVAPGGSVHGRVAVTTEGEIKVKRASIALGAFHARPANQAPARHWHLDDAEEILCDDDVLPAGTREWSFALRVPDDAEPSCRASGAAARWWVTVRFEYKGWRAAFETDIARQEILVYDAS
ncbi:MAG TPA: hypothetical protein VFY33_05725 [Solirubrobacterales bacterium]|nr:hypothetical protein [Solirubrobacterales bacterium]